jgi:type II secretory pathway pseudopilin PulG
MTVHYPWGERGYAMAALLVAMTVMAIALATIMPVHQTVARREREAELVFRGEQYARAIGLFQRKYGNAAPPDVDVLIKERFLRKKYKDPITGGEFQYLGPSSPELAKALSTLPQQMQGAQRGRGAGARGGTPTAPQARGAQQSFQTGRAQSGFQTGGVQTGGAQATFQTGGGQSTFQTGRAQGTPPGFGQSATGSAFGRGAMTAAGRGASAQAAGGLVAVASKSTETSIRLYNGKNKYNEWIFMALAATTAAGAPGGAGAATPGGRGGTAPGGRGGTAPGRGGMNPGGRGNTPPAPAGGTRGRGGFSPIGGR